MNENLKRLPMDNTKHMGAGRLKVFFGMCAGVGKTTAMLEAARNKLRDGVKVLIGAVETHGSEDISLLLENFKTVDSVTVHSSEKDNGEFSLTTILQNPPQIVLIDDMAGSSLPTSHHSRRYQDVRELLSQGIDVYTTLNVHNLESRADVINISKSQSAPDTVPDMVLDWANEIVLVDFSPEELRQRLAEGKVYVDNKPATVDNPFFSMKNLAIMREMALRLTAEHVNRGLIQMLKEKSQAKPIPTGERILVAVGPSPFSEKIVRWTKRYASSLNASWVAVHVERSDPMDAKAQKQLSANLQLAQNLGAEVVSASGDDVAQSLLRTARRELVTQIVVGRSPHSPLRGLFTGGTLSDRLVAGSGAVAVHVVPGLDKPAKINWSRLRESAVSGTAEYVWALGGALVLNLICYPIRAEIGHWTVALLFLALTVLGGFFLSRGPVLVLAIVLAMGWNFFFVPPQFTLQIHSGQDILLFFVLLLVATTMGQLTARLRALNLAERRRETRSYALYRFLDCLNQQADPLITIEEALAHASEVTSCQIGLVIGNAGRISNRILPAGLTLTDEELKAVAWVGETLEMAGPQTQTYTELSCLFLPVESEGKSLGVLRVQLKSEFLPIAVRDLLNQMARLLGRFLERELLRTEAEKAQVLETSQRLQKTLLDTVSHELKTPLTIILGVLEQIADEFDSNDPESELLSHAERSAKRLLRNVNMLLDLTRYEGGIVKPNYEVVDLEDLTHQLTRELREEFSSRVEQIEFELDVDAVRADEGLLFQLINQLLRNALSHTPTETLIYCRFEMEESQCRITVCDNGPGLPEDTEALFVAFSHGSNRRSKGMGLGLSIARRICETMGGTLAAENTSEGGARFVAKLPSTNPTRA